MRRQGTRQSALPSQELPPNAGVSGCSKTDSCTARLSVISVFVSGIDFLHSPPQRGRSILFSYLFRAGGLYVVRPEMVEKLLSLGASAEGTAKVRGMCEMLCRMRDEGLYARGGGNEEADAF